LPILPTGYKYFYIIRYDAPTQTIYAMPTEGIIQFNQEWKFLLFFIDSKGSKSNLTCNVKIEDNSEVYYKTIIRFRSLMPSTTPYLDLQLKMLEMISEFTKGRVDLDSYRVVSFERDNQQNEVFLMTYGDCSVNETICKSEETRLKDAESTLIVPGQTTPQDSFKTFLQVVFEIQFIQREPINLAVLPGPSKLNYDEIEINECETQRIDIRTFFADDRSLEYTLKHSVSGEEVPLNYWLQKNGRVIYVYPWLNVDVGKYKFDLVATDKCQNSETATFTVNIKNVYGDRENPVFGYSWTIRVKMQDMDSTVPDVYYLDQITRVMLTYVNSGQTPEYTITIISYRRLDDDFEVKYGECTIIYFPCDQTGITKLNRKLFPTGTGVGVVLQQQFTNLGTVTYFVGNRQETCGTPEDGPKCRKELQINSTYCEVLKFNIPADLCSDKEDGSLKNLNVQFLNVQGENVQPMSWIQYNGTSQTIYGYPFYSEDTVIPSNMTYLLRVLDKDNKATFVNVYVTLYGDTPNMNYEMTMFASISSQGLRSYVDERLCIARQLGRFFDRNDINNIEYEDLQVNNVRFRWTFCKQKKVMCECKVVKMSQDKLRDDYQGFNSMMSACRINVQSTSNKLFGVCEETNGPVIKDRIETTEIGVGQTYTRPLPADMFTDTEDGDIRNMTLYITDPNDKRLEDATWMQVNDGNSRLCGMLAYKEYEEKGYQQVETLTYEMTTVDSCGKTATEPFEVEIVNNFPAIKYRIVLILARAYKEHDCAKTEGLINTISDYSKVPIDDIFVDEFRDSRLNNTNGSYFAWGVRQYTDHNCEGEEFKTFREMFMKDGKGNEQFLRRMENKDHEVADVYDIVDKECLGGFPWWILILILLLLLLFLLLWCLWCCIPRCCAGPCLRKCPGCASCCKKGGRYSSTRTDVEGYPSDSDEDELLSRPIPPTAPGDQPDGRPLPMGDDPGPYPDGFNLPPSYRTETDKDDIDHGDPNFISRSGYIDGLPTGNPDFHTESWTDTRVPNILGRNTGTDYATTGIVGRQDFGDESYYYNRSGVTDRRFVDSYHNRTGGSVAPYVLPGPRTNYIRSYPRHYPIRTGSRGSRVVRFRNGGINKRSSDYKIRRGDYREYIDRRRADENYDESGGLYITENDLNEMMRIKKMRRAATGRRGGGGYTYVPTERHIVRTDSRLADALVDRSYIRKYRHQDYDNRRYSTGSLLRAENAAIDPHNLHLRIEDNRYDSHRSPYYSTDSYYSSGIPGSERMARPYYIDRNYFRNRSIGDRGSGSSANDFIMNSYHPTTTRKINLYKKSLNGGDSISDGAHSAAGRRRIVYRTNSNAARAGDGEVRTRFRTSTSGTRRANTTTTRSYHNAGYDYGESSV